MAPGGCGICLRRASRAMPQGFWTFTTRLTSCGRGRPPGWMGGPPRPAGGLPGLGTACATACRTASWQTLRTVYAYLERHREHINYARYKALGLPLGSGMVESACKWLIQQRFKGVGMRWSEDGFNHLLHLRLAWVNGSFEALFQVQLHPSPNT